MLPMQTLAAATTTGGGSSTIFLVLIAVLFIGMMFLMNRNAKKRQQQATEFRDRLRPGQEVMTIGRIVGSITDVDGDIVTIETTPGVSIRVNKAGIHSLVDDMDATDEEVEDAEADSASEIEPADVPESGVEKQSDTIWLNGKEVPREDLGK